MPFKVTGSQALAIAGANPMRQWVGGGKGNSAQERLTTGQYFTVSHTPKFQIDRSARVFTMGSCFAREVEHALLRQKIDLVTKDCGIEPEMFESWNETAGTGGGVPKGTLSRGAFNKYTIASMTHEIRRVLLDEKHEHDGLIELQPGVWFDPHSAGTKSGAFDMVQACRQRVADATRQIRSADFVFLTLGLVEGWLDTVTGLAMNRAPTGRALVKLADRFELVVPTYNEAVAELEASIALIRQVCNPNMRFIVTVSPVPFHATFRPLDVVVANTLSKGLLRTVCDELTSKYDYVDYFPSYELVTNSPRELAWAADQLHVHHKMVGHVMQVFLSRYVVD
jgi:hypothetical protein